jgi:elongation factor 3
LSRNRFAIASQSLCNRFTIALQSLITIFCPRLIFFFSQVNPEDEEEDLCNAQFSLAYGTRVLLHQTPFKVKIGRKYGLVGANGAGKSTLMKSIAGGNLAGFPTELITVYVECEIIGEKADLSVIEYIMCDEKIQKCGVETMKVNM